MPTLLAALLLILLAACGSLAADGTGPAVTWREGRWVDTAGKPVVLKGCNLGNWLILEPWMFGGTLPVQDQQDLVGRLTRRLGAEACARILDAHRDTWITARDFATMRRCGLNTVRIPFDSRLLADDAAPVPALHPDAFRWLDIAVQRASDAGMSIILDLHGTPGGQNDDQTTGQRGRNGLWTEVRHQDLTVQLWEAIAKRYRNAPQVIMYDLINEPYGASGALEPALVRLVERLVPAIRAIDPERVILAPGATTGIEMYGDPRTRGWERVGFTEHAYPGLFGDAPEVASHARYLNQFAPYRAAYVARLGVPFLLGEFNAVLEKAGGTRMTRMYFDRCAAYGWAATMWSYRLVKKEAGAAPDAWYLTTNAAAIPAIDPDTASAAELEAWFTAVGRGEQAPNAALEASLTAERPEPIPLREFAPLRLPPAPVEALDPWQAVDLGTATTPGGQEGRADRFTLFAGGTDIWGAQDSCRFVHQGPLTGDFTLTCTLPPYEETHPFAKAGLMLRPSLDPAAPFLLLGALGSDRLIRSERSAPGGPAKEQAAGHRTATVHLRLVRRGDVITASTDTGAGWQDVGTTPWHGPALAGFAATAHRAGVLMPVTVADLRLAP